MTRPSGKARLDERGRLVLPVVMRRRLGLRAGDEVLISEEPSGVLRVETRRSAAQALVGSAGREERSMVDELLLERREQAAAEDQDAASGLL